MNGGSVTGYLFFMIGSRSLYLYQCLGLVVRCIMVPYFYKFEAMLWHTFR